MPWHVPIDEFGVLAKMDDITIRFGDTYKSLEEGPRAARPAPFWKGPSERGAYTSSSRLWLRREVLDSRFRAQSANQDQTYFEGMRKELCDVLDRHVKGVTYAWSICASNETAEGMTERDVSFYMCSEAPVLVHGIPRQPCDTMYAKWVYVWERVWGDVLPFMVGTTQNSTPTGGHSCTSWPNFRAS